MNVPVADIGSRFFPAIRAVPSRMARSATRKARQGRLFLLYPLDTAVFGSVFGEARLLCLHQPLPFGRRILTMVTCGQPKEV